MRSPRFAVSAAFLVLGVTGGTLVPRLPALKEQLQLTDGQVGLALVAYAVGAVSGAMAARLVLSRGARSLVRATTVVMCGAVVGPALATGLIGFLAAFLFIGVCAGLLDVLENSQAAEIERDAGRPMINGFHGFWSLGAVVGSVGSAAAAHAALSPLVHFAVVAAVLAAVSIPLLSGLPDTRAGAATLLPGGTTRWRLGTVIGALAAIAFLGILVESGGGDWSAIYLHDVAHADLGVAAVGYAGLTLAMTLVRFFADRVTARTSRGVVVGLGGLVAGSGIALALAVPVPAVAIAGFSLVGAGAAVIVPLAFSAAANLESSGTALSLVLSSAYAASLVGPFAIGSTADRFGLRVALLIPLIAAVAVMLTAVSLRPLSARSASTAGQFEAGAADAPVRSQ